MNSPRANLSRTGQAFRVDPGNPYQLVQLPGGAHSIRSVSHGETMHPGLGPVAEARLLYVDQIGLVARANRAQGDLVIWDIGLGAGANALTVLEALRQTDRRIRLLSFDETLEPLRFAYAHRGKLPYFAGHEATVERLLSSQAVVFHHSRATSKWSVRVGDFPAFLEQPEASNLPPPDVILFDPWSPAKNPAMWTAGLFTRLFGLLSPGRPCVLPTYSRSTMLRVTLLLAGFRVGAGLAAGRKEETTLAANIPQEVSRPLDSRWLERAARSDCAEPIWEPIYRKARLSPATWDRLRQHPQFR